MEHYAGIDVSLEQSSVCVVAGTGRIVRAVKLASAPEALIAWFAGLGFAVTRIGLEAGPLSPCGLAGGWAPGRAARDAPCPCRLRGDATQACPRAGKAGPVGRTGRTPAASPS